MTRVSRPRWCAALAIALLPVAVVATAHPAASRSPAPASPRSGESWYGTVEWAGAGSVRVDGGVYVSHDSHAARAVKNAQSVRITSRIDSKITRPDPDPATDGCWTRLETWRGTGTTTGYLQVAETGALPGRRLRHHVDVGGARGQVRRRHRRGGLLGR